MTFSSCERNVLGYLGNGHYSAFRGAILSAVHTVLVLSTYMKLGSGQVRKEQTWNSGSSQAAALGMTIPTLGKLPK